MNSKDRIIEELQLQIKELTEENERLRAKRTNRNIVTKMQAQSELNLIDPYYRTLGINKWTRCSAIRYFTQLRSLATSVVNPVYGNNTFKEVKLKDLSEHDLEFVAQCADDLARVAAYYKAEFLRSKNRDDIVRAFNYEPSVVLCNKKIYENLFLLTSLYNKTYLSSEERSIDEDKSIFNTLLNLAVKFERVYDDDKDDYFSYINEWGIKELHKVFDRKE